MPTQHRPFVRCVGAAHATWGVPMSAGDGAGNFGIYQQQMLAIPAVGRTSVNPGVSFAARISRRPHLASGFWGRFLVISSGTNPTAPGLERAIYDYAGAALNSPEAACTDEGARRLPPAVAQFLEIVEHRPTSEPVVI